MIRCVRRRVPSGCNTSRWDHTQAEGLRTRPSGRRLFTLKSFSLATWHSKGWGIFRLGAFRYLEHVLSYINYRTRLARYYLLRTFLPNFLVAYFVKKIWTKLSLFICLINKVLFTYFFRSRRRSERNSLEKYTFWCYIGVVIIIQPWYTYVSYTFLVFWSD